MRFARTLALGALTALVGVHLVFFAIRAWHVLTFPYPLDYGEGPLLAQVNHLRSGASLPHLYGDPAQPPYLVVNYPPVYLIVTSLVAPLLDWTLPGSATTLLAGRLVTFCATLICALLIWRLAATTQPVDAPYLHRDNQVRRSSLPSRFWRCRLCVNGAH
jgi:hypothetical protein